MDKISYAKFIGILYDNLLSKKKLEYLIKAKDLKDKNERVEEYFSYLERKFYSLVSSFDFEKLKNELYEEYIIKEENLTRYLENLKKLTDEEKQKETNRIIQMQKESFDIWFEYLLSEKSLSIPIWAKVWTFYGMLGIGKYDTNKEKYLNRSASSISPFIEFDEEILLQSIEILKKHLNNENIDESIINSQIKIESFKAIYGYLLANKKKIKTKEQKGIWKKYNFQTHEEAKECLENNQKPEYLKLFDDVKDYNTGWCTSITEMYAKYQISGGGSLKYGGGDFYVYFTMDENEEFTIPRIAIRMEQDEVKEVEGIDKSQNIEHNLLEVLEEKLKELKADKLLFETLSDLKRLREIKQKYEDTNTLTIEEKIFLYELNRKIKYFGKYIDKTVNEILKTRNKLEDLTSVFKFLDKIEGSLDLSEFKTLEDFKFPEEIEEELTLGLTTLENIKLPKAKCICFKNLLRIKDIKFQEGTNLDFEKSFMREVENVTFPVMLNNDLYLDLFKLKNVRLPQEINGNFSFTYNNDLELEDIYLPSIINGNMNLNIIKQIDINGLIKLFKNIICIEGDLYFSHISKDILLEFLEKSKNEEWFKSVNNIYYKSSDDTYNLKEIFEEKTLVKNRFNK